MSKKIQLNEIYSDIIKELSLDFIDNPSLEARMILSNCLKVSISKILTDKNDIIISNQQKKSIYSIVKKRKQKISLARLLKKKDFFDVELFIDSSILIPRPETELLIDIVLQRIKKNSPVKILDIGTGSANIAITLAKHLPFSQIDAIDIKKDSLKTAKINIEKNNIPPHQIKLLRKDFFNFSPLPNSYDLIVSNPPYIPTKETNRLLANKTLDDPLVSLDGGKDGLDFYRRFVFFIDKVLSPKGWCVLEHGLGQREKIIQIFSCIDNITIEYFNDYQGIDRIIVIKKDNE